MTARRIHPARLPLLLLSLFALNPWAIAQEPPKPIEIAKLNRAADKPVSYINEIVDILENKCTGCHNDALAENKLKMETVEQMLKGGKKGPVLVAGKADQSLMFQMGTHRIEPVMPPKDKKDLKSWTPEEAALIKLWIDQGAKDDSDSDMSEKVKPPLILGELPAKFAPIYALDLSPDERTLAVARGAQLHLVEPVSGFNIATLGGHKDAIQSVRFRPDSRELSAGSYAVVTRWELPAADLKKALDKMAFETTQIVAEPGSANFWGLSAKEPKIRLVEPLTGKEIRAVTWKGGVAQRLARSAFEPYIAIIDDTNAVRVLNSEKGDELQLIKAADSAKYTSIAWLSKSRLAAGRNDGKVQVFEVTAAGKDGLKTSAELGTTKKGGVTRLIPVHDGKQAVAVIDDQSLELLDLEAKKTIKEMPVAGAKITAVSDVTKDGQILVGQADGTIARYSADLATRSAENKASTSPVIALLNGQKNAIQLYAVHQNGLVRLMKSADLSLIWAWNSVTTSPVVAAVNATAAGIGANDEFVVSGKDNSWKSWTVTGQIAALPSLDGHVDRILAIDYSPDGKKMVTTGGMASRSGEVKIWDVASAKLEKSLDQLHSDTVFGVRFSPDGKFIATCAADKFAKVTQLSDFKTLRPLEGHTNHVLGLDWKPDGKQIATAGADSALKLWNVETGEQVRSAQSAGKQITAVRWSPTKPVVAGTSGDKLVRFWNPDNGQISRTFSGANDFLFAVAMNRDATVVFSAGQNGTVQVWNGNDGKLVRTQEFAAPLKDVATK